jgi:hypothetical protein
MGSRYRVRVRIRDVVGAEDEEEAGDEEGGDAAQVYMQSGLDGPLNSPAHPSSCSLYLIRGDEGRKK